jgi:hypothetical protein
MAHANFYDSVLTELQAGNVQDGINLLVGMLDSTGDDAALFKRASAELQAHDLWALLLHDPLCAHAAAQPEDTHALGDILCHDPKESATSSTGFRIFGVTRELTFCRAFRERRRQASEILVRAWKAGRRICMPGCSDFSALEGLAGHDLSNITVADANPDCLAKLKGQLGPSIIAIAQEPAEFLRSEQASGHRFDLICAAEQLDGLAPTSLAATLSAMRGILWPDGKILTASMLPDHLGSGWRRACLGWDIHCHDEAQIEAAAAVAGLTAQTYRDATNCVVWADYRSDKSEQEGNNAHGY